MIASIVLV